MYVLLATDGSAGSRAAIQRVRTFFPHGRIDVVSVVPPPVMTSSLNPFSPSAPLMDPQLEEDLATSAIRFADPCLGEGHGVTYGKLHGDPATTIVQVAGDRDVDAIVVGNHGRSALERLVMGSVATAVVNHATCPVLVLR
ncbi:MAG: universal stress protein [Candidatus Sericytochromatia bacterium]|nr:universal stress protein [Candidatus Sericytochromatia bacterium]